MTDFTDRTAMLAMVQTLAKGAYDEAAAGMYLDLATGVDASATTHYRPMWVAAKLIQTNPNQLLEGRGAVLADPLEVADNLLEQQLNYDETQALTVPDAYKAYRRGILNFYTPPEVV
jgi:hypothetical protein